MPRHQETPQTRASELQALARLRPRPAGLSPHYDRKLPVRNAFICYTWILRLRNEAPAARPHDQVRPQDIFTSLRGASSSRSHGSITKPLYFLMHTSFPANMVCLACRLFRPRHSSRAVPTAVACGNAQGPAKAEDVTHPRGCSHQAASLTQYYPKTTATVYKQIPPPALGAQGLHSSQPFRTDPTRTEHRRPKTAPAAGGHSEPGLVAKSSSPPGKTGMHWVLHRYMSLYGYTQTYICSCFMYACMPCMHAYMHACTYVCICVCVHICECKDSYLCLCTVAMNVDACTNIYLFVSPVLYISVYIYIYTCMHVYKHAHMLICLCTRN